MLFGRMRVALLQGQYELCLDTAAHLRSKGKSSKYNINIDGLGWPARAESLHEIFCMLLVQFYKFF
jgi:hypothetical protein